MKPLAFVIVLGLLWGCTKSAPPAAAASAESLTNQPDYLDYSGRDDVLSYDQLGSFYSDQPNDPSLWEISRLTYMEGVVKFIEDVDAGRF